MTDAPNRWSLMRMAAKLRGGDISARDLLESHLARIEERSNLNAYIRILTADARDAADRTDRDSANPGPLHGLPIAIKDNILVQDVPCTCGSRMLKDWIAPYDATVVERLRSAGAVLIGKTNCDEFGMGSSNENSYFGPVRNPHDPERTPGGSSGGSGAAVADFQAAAALGSDTGGSIRLPASFCGVVGLKPTYGAVSRWGLVAFGSSLDQIGILTRHVADARLVFDVIAGHDPRDSTAMHAPSPVPVKDRVTIGLPREYFEEGLDPEVRQAIVDLAGRLQSEGHRVVDVSLPHAKYAVAAYYVICCAEASSNLARYDGVKYGHRAAASRDLLDMYRRTRAEGFGDEVKRRILLGTYVLSAGYYDAFYGTAQKVRSRIAGDFTRTLAQVDVLLAPTASGTAFRLGDVRDDPLAMYLMDIYTTSVNLAGLPALSVPCGTTAAGLPVGAQLIGGPFQEHQILRVGEMIEQVTGRGMETL